MNQLHGGRVAGWVSNWLAGWSSQIIIPQGPTFGSPIWGQVWQNKIKAHDFGCPKPHLLMTNLKGYPLQIDVIRIKLVNFIT